MARSNWREIAHSLDYGYFRNVDGTEAWREDVAYRFAPEVVSQIGLAASRLHQMCLRFVDDAVRSPEIMAEFGIPEAMHPVIRSSWERRDPFFIGRFDFALVGGIPKLIEYNADTPATVPESTVMQKRWLADIHPDAAQASWLESSTIAWLRRLRMRGHLPDLVHVVPYPGNVEDASHGRLYVRWLAAVGVAAEIAELADIEVSTTGELLHRGRIIRAMVRMYPWELMFRESGARHLLTATCRFLSPPWTALLSNKALLTALWARHPGHPNLLRAQDTPDGMERYVAKPVCSRGGENVSIVHDGVTVAAQDGSYGAYRTIYQDYADARIGDVHASIGAWVVGDGQFAGITMRESRDMIVRESAAIVPHLIA